MDIDNPQPECPQIDLPPSDTVPPGLRERVAAWAEHRAWLENTEELVEPAIHYRRSELVAVRIVAELADVYDRIEETFGQIEREVQERRTQLAVLDLRELAAALINDLTLDEENDHAAAEHAVTSGTATEDGQKPEAEKANKSGGRTTRLYNFGTETNRDGPAPGPMHEHSL